LPTAHLFVAAWEFGSAGKKKARSHDLAMRVWTGLVQNQIEAIDDRQGELEESLTQIIQLCDWVELLPAHLRLS
jgi:hypothetical protein